MSQKQLIETLERHGYYGKIRGSRKPKKPPINIERLREIAKLLPEIDNQDMNGAAAARFLAERGIRTRGGGVMNSSQFYRYRDMIESGLCD